MIRYSIVTQEEVKKSVNSKLQQFKSGNLQTKQLESIEKLNITKFERGDINPDKLINNVPELVTKIEEEKIRNMEVGKTLSITRIITETLFITKQERNE